MLVNVPLPFCLLAQVEHPMGKGEMGSACLGESPGAERTPCTGLDWAAQGDGRMGGESKAPKDNKHPSATQTCRTTVLPSQSCKPRGTLGPHGQRRQGQDLTAGFNKGVKYTSVFNRQRPAREGNCVAWDRQATALPGTLHMDTDSSIWPREPNLEQG